MADDVRMTSVLHQITKKKSMLEKTIFAKSII